MAEDLYDGTDEENGDEREVTGAAIVLDGSFNPGIIHPYWFLANGMLAEAEAEEASQKGTTTSEASEFTVADYAFRCRRTRLRVASTIESAEVDKVRDVVVDTLRVLPHMPVRVAFLNRSAHIPLDREPWRALADRLYLRAAGMKIFPPRPWLH